MRKHKSTQCKHLTVTCTTWISVTESSLPGGPGRGGGIWFSLLHLVHVEVTRISSRSGEQEPPRSWLKWLAAGREVGLLGMPGGSHQQTTMRVSGRGRGGREGGGKRREGIEERRGRVRRGVKGRREEKGVWYLTTPHLCTKLFVYA